jgi:regulator of protease activity HflC (stomatin/prohibitin superfamily)
MKRLFLFAGTFSLLIFIFVACSRVSVDVNEEIVFDKHPLFGKGGIDPTPLQEGSCVTSVYTKTYKFTMTPVQYEENFANLFTNDQTSVNLNAFLTLKINKGKSPVLLRNFGMEWYKNSVQERFREIVRDKLCSFSMLDLIANRHLYDNEIKEHVREQLGNYMAEKSLPIEITSLVISKVEPPEEVRNELNTLSQEKAKEQTQKQRLSTEKARLEAEKARAKADNAYMREMGFTPEQYINYLRAEALQNRSDIIRIEAVK